VKWWQELLWLSGFFAFIALVTACDDFESIPARERRITEQVRHEIKKCSTNDLARVVRISQLSCSPNTLDYSKAQCKLDIIRSLCLEGEM
jgi:hypothetical protein